ncbi:transposase [Trinickia dinghuensis]|uniref:Transposase n=1 Tax=Trinickia dinghuensis TaxID=2291023 RepID=A0A3D8JX40_9BURK|nr:transposase [Trinickia dinghuensis]RDU97372.1 transposase [Trinickia dinghuensis]
MTPYSDITDQQWERIVPLFPELSPRGRVRGRPVTDTRAVLNGVLWVIYSNAAWASIPKRYPAYQTCHRRFSTWYEAGIFKQVLTRLYGEAGLALCDTIKARIREKKPGKPRKPAPPPFVTVDLPRLTYLASLRRAA